MSDIQANPNPQAGAVTWDAFIESQPEEIKTLYQSANTGLLSALQTERKANKEASQKLRRLEELEKAEEQRKKQEMSEAELKTAEIAGLQSKLAELEAKLAAEQSAYNTERIHAEVKLQAMKLGFADPADAINLADLSGVELKDGKIEGVTKTLEALIKAKPYLVNGAAKPGTPAPKPANQQRPPAEQPKAGPAIRF